MLAVLGLVDVVMIANLLIMVIIGGYETFVSRIKLDDHPDQPEWLSHVNANVLKTKLAMSIIGISSIHLLASFIRRRVHPRGAARQRRAPVADRDPPRVHPVRRRARLDRQDLGQAPAEGGARASTRLGVRSRTRPRSPTTDATR